MRALLDLAVPVPRSGDGTGHARTVGRFLASRSRRKDGRVWVSNSTIARRTGMDDRDVERALPLLDRSGYIEIVHEHRPDLKHHRGRSLILKPGTPELPWPSGEHVGALWALTRAVRPDDSRVVALVELGLTAWIFASIANGGPLDEDRLLGCTNTQLRGLTGAAAGGSWSRQLRELERAGVFRRGGPGKTWRSTGLIVVADLLPELRRRGIDAESVAARSVHRFLLRQVERHRSPVIWPSIETIATRTGLAEPSVRAGVRRLEADGQIATRPPCLVGDRWRREILVMDGSPAARDAAAHWHRRADPDAGRWDDPDYVAEMDRLAEEFAARDATA